MTYKLEINQSLFFQDEEEARQLGQFIDYLTQDNKNHGVICLSEATGVGGFKELNLYKPVPQPATSLRQECHTTVLNVIKSLSARFEDTEFDVSHMTKNVVVLAEGTSMYTVDYKVLYQNFVEIVGGEQAEAFKESISEVLTAQSLRGIKGIKI